MSNLYVSYDDLLSVMSREKLDTLPTIDLSVIDDMIEEIKTAFPDNKNYTQFGKWLITGKLDSLNMIKQRLSTNK